MQPPEFMEKISATKGVGKSAQLPPAQIFYRLLPFEELWELAKTDLAAREELAKRQKTYWKNQEE
jgi:hypothetical protein